MSTRKPYKTSIPATLSGSIGEQEEAQRNKKTARKLHGSFPKGDVRHWTTRVKRENSSDYGIQILFRGERRRFPLKTANRETAARKALAIYQSLVANGWETVLREHKPETVKPTRPATVGELIEAVRSTAGFKRATFTAYTQSLRQIASEIAEIRDQPELTELGEPVRDQKKRIIYKSRRDHRSGGRDAWQAKVDALALNVINPDNVQRWRLAYVARAGSAPDLRRRAENSAASLIRNARALFSEKALQFAQSKLTLPDPLPFAGVKLPKRGNTRYASKIDAHALIADAKMELDGAPFQIFALGLLCGLRKREIDLLAWTQVDFTSSQIRIERTEWFEPKSEDSIGVVDVDLELLALLRGWKAASKGPFVIESSRRPHQDENPANYRCQTHFKTLYIWLRAKGVTANKPLHELRKELGALLASSQGIFAAQSVLRHAQISTTADYYADKKRTITAGLGALLVASAHNVTPADFRPAEVVSKAKRKRLSKGSKL
jgi:integrase